METKNSFFDNLFKDRRLSLILALILLAGSFALQFISNKYLQGDWVFLTFLVSEWLMLFAILIFIQRRMKGGIAAINLVPEGAARNYGVGILIGTVMFILFILVAVLSKTYGWNGLADPINWVMVLLFAIAFVGQAALEEVVFRGFLLRFIGRRTSILLGLIVSSIVFSLLHLPGRETTLLVFINTFLLAALFSFLVLLTRSLYLPCGLHFAWNFVEMVVFNTPNSSERVSTAVFKTSYLSNNINLTGGSYGPEGSIFTTIIVSLFLIVTLILYARNRGLKELLTKE